MQILTSNLINISRNYFSAIDKKISDSPTLKTWWRFNEIPDMNHIKYIVFVGSSVCWKSTILDFIRKELVSDSWWGQSLVHKRIDTYIPERFVNRERRESPDENQNTLEDTENRYCSPGEYNELLKNGKIGVNWERELAWKTSQYGFTSFNDIEMEQKWMYQMLKSISQDCTTIPVHIRDPRSLVLLSWNNAFYSNSHTINWFSEDDIKSTLVVGVYAWEDTRIERIQSRSPHMDIIEARARLKDCANNMIPKSHIFVDTTKWWNTPNIEAYELMRIIADVNMKKNSFNIDESVNGKVLEII